MRILVVEDEEMIRKNLVSLLELEGYHVSEASNGKEALDKTKGKTFDLFIVDLMMPILSGEQYIKQLKIKDPDAVVIVLTAVVNPDKIVEIMRYGAYDYLIKPFDHKKLLATISSALQYKTSIETQKNNEFLSSKAIQSDIIWNNYKEQTLNKENILTSINLINNLQSTISQGSGFGSAMTLTDMISMSRELYQKESDKYYLINADIVDLLVSNNNLCRQQINSITNALEIFTQNSIDLFPSTSGQIFEIITEVLQQFSSVALERKKVKVFASENSHNYNILANETFLRTIFEELIVNAIKFSLPNTKISIFSSFLDGFVIYSIINVVDETLGNITTEQEQLILRPFLRLMPYVEEFYDIEKFGMGLGLSVVNQITKLHNGVFSIKNVTEHLDEKPKKCVISKVALPVS
jgi:CheY-like chemotaxis protein